VKRLSDQTLYEIIEISVDAPPEEVERACHRAAATYGPGSLATYTLASAEETALLSSRIEEARAVLLDPSARARYDERIGVRQATPSAEPDRQPGPTLVPPPAQTPWPTPGAEPMPLQPRPISPGLPAVAPSSPPVEPVPAVSAEPAPAPRVEPAPASSATTAPSATPAPAPIPLTVLAAPGPIALTRPVAPILLEREVGAPRELTVPVGSDWSGEMLRRVRESRGITVQQMAERTRITRHHLENIEQDRFTALPAPVYLRGIIMSLARELRLDGQKVARSYLDRMGVGTDGQPGK
jgi:Helix-turn-helix domain